MKSPFRLARVPVALAAGFVTAALTFSSFAPQASAEVVRSPLMSSALSSCQTYAPSQAPHVFWVHFKQAVYAHRDIPKTFWRSRTYRRDVARIVCYESTFNLHAENPSGYYGWFQMSRPLVSSEGVSFPHYWSGSHWDPSGWYQVTAGARYIRSRYRNPATAWRHEVDYGWY